MREPSASPESVMTTAAGTYSEQEESNSLYEMTLGLYISKHVSECW